MDLANHPLTCKQGSKFEFFFTWKIQNPETKVWEPVDLTGFKARLTVQVDGNAAEPMVEMTTENGCITLGGTAGTVSCKLASAATSELPLGVWEYDFDIIDPSLEPDRMLEGMFEVVK